MKNVRTRLIETTQAFAARSETKAWRSKRSGWACSVDSTGHAPPPSTSAVEAAELSMVGMARCQHCGEDILWEPSPAMVEQPDSPPLALDENWRAERRLISETERKMTEPDPPLPLPKLQPDGEADVVRRVPDEKLRRFRAMYGRAPTLEELDAMLRKP